MKIYFYYFNICKNEHEMNMRGLWRNIVPKIDVEHTKKNEGFYFYLYPFGDLAQGNFQRGFYVCSK